MTEIYFFFDRFNGVDINSVYMVVGIVLGGLYVFLNFYSIFVKLQNFVNNFLVSRCDLNKLVKDEIFSVVRSSSGILFSQGGQCGFS